MATAYSIAAIKRRALIFSLLYGLVVGIFVAVVSVMQNILYARMQVNRFLVPVIALFIITIFIRPLGNLLVSWTDKFLYQKRYDYRKTLEEASKGMLLVTDANKLLNLIVRILSKHIRVTNSAIYVYDKGRNSYVCNTRRSQKSEHVEQIKTQSAVVEWMREKKTPLLACEVINWIQKEAAFSHKIVLKKTLEQLKTDMHKLGASICVPSFVRNEMAGFLVLGDKLSGTPYTKEDVALLSTLSNQAAVAVENARIYESINQRVRDLNELYKEQHGLFIDTATVFSLAVDFRDAYTHQHANRVFKYCMVILNGMIKINAGFSRDAVFVERLKISVLLHDIGKIGISDEIWSKKGKLTPEEYEQVKRHPLIAVNILKPIKELRDISDIVKYHHENYDETGYPEGLKGDDIPFTARILTVANAYDAMTSDRPYRKTMSYKEAENELKRCSGSQFDPLVVEAFLVGLGGAV